MPADSARRAPGRTGEPTFLIVDQAQQMLTPSLITAAGLDRSKTADPPPPVLWEDGDRRLLVHLESAKLAFDHGVVDVSIDVECDQTQRQSVTCTFVTSSPERPAGFIWATESRPRGPAIIVEQWGDALIALCWRALVDLARLAAAGQGVDTFDQPLIASTVVASPDGFMVVPLAAHRFMRLGSATR